MNPHYPKVVACLPSYNAEVFIEKTLHCLKDQTYPNLEVLISDDCSTDNTVNIIKSIIDRDTRFHLIEQKRNLGWIDNVNTMMEKAVEMGKYVFIMPHDDLITPEYVTKLTTILEQNPSTVLAFCDVDCTYANQENVILKYDQLDKCFPAKEQTLMLLKRRGPWWNPYRGIVRSSAVERIIPQDKNLGGNDFQLDWIWLIKLSLIGKFMRLPEVLYFKYHQKTSRSSQWNFKKRDYIKIFLNGSLTLFHWKVLLKDQLHYQAIIFIHIIKEVLRWNFRSSIVKTIKVRFVVLLKRIQNS